MKYNQIVKERDTIREEIKKMQEAAASGKAVGSSSSAAADHAWQHEASPGMRFGIVSLLIVAMLASFLGHYLVQMGAGKAPAASAL